MWRTKELIKDCLLLVFFFNTLGSKTISIGYEEVSVSKLAFYHEEKLKNNVVTSSYLLQEIKSIWFGNKKINNDF